MAIGKSIRVYDLAREVKQDTKRVMEDLRREGADVSVPSNTIPHELAEKVRSRYFPKTEVAPKRGIKIIKKAAKPAGEPIAEETDAPQIEETIAGRPSPRRLRPRRSKAPAPTPAEAPKPRVKVLAKKPIAEPVAEPEAVPEVEARGSPACGRGACYRAGGRGAGDTSRDGASRGWERS